MANYDNYIVNFKENINTSNFTSLESNLMGLNNSLYNNFIYTIEQLKTALVLMITQIAVT